MPAYAELAPCDLWKRAEKVVTVDVRAPHEFVGPLGHIEGSRLQPMEFLGEFLRSFPAEKPVVFVCRSGRRSGVACERAVERGLRDVANLVGGMIAWNEAELPIAKQEPISLDGLIEGIVVWLAQVSGLDEEAARTRMDSHLSRAEIRFAAPEASRVERMLASLERELACDAPPPDLRVAFDSFRESLARLGELR